LNPFKPVISPKNKPFFTETLKVSKSVAAPPKNRIGKAETFAFTLPSLLCSPVISKILVGQFAWVKLDYLESLLCPGEHLDKEVEIGC